MAVVFSLVMISQAVGQELTDKQKAGACFWALGLAEMSNGAAGIFGKGPGLELTEGNGANSSGRWGEPKTIKRCCPSSGNADGKLTLPTGQAVFENRSARVSRWTLYRGAGNARFHHEGGIRPWTRGCR